MQIYLIRHGQTPGNAARKYLGVTDEPLSATGVAAAKAAGSDAGVEQVLVTPLKRTQMTAALLFPNAEQIICPGLREMDFGDFEGRSAEEMRDDPDYRYWVEQTGCMGPCPHGDATMVFQRRVCAVFCREVEKAQRAGKDRLYFVVHGGVVMSVLYRFAHPQKSFYSWPLANCQGYRCEVLWEEGEPVLKDVTHLDGVAR